MVEQPPPRPVVPPLEWVRVYVRLPVQLHRELVAIAERRRKPVALVMRQLLALCVKRMASGEDTYQQRPGRRPTGDGGVRS